MTKEIIAVGCADNHLPDNNRIWNNRPIEGDALFSLEQTIATAEEYDAPQVLAAGDFLDKNIVKSPILDMTFTLLDRLVRANKLLSYIRGQHEGLCNYLALHSATRWIHKQEMIISPHFPDIKMYGIDYQPIGLLQEELKAVPEGTSVLLTHQVWSNWMGAVTNPQGALEQIRRAKLTLNGDNHEAYIDETITCEDGHTMRVINPGSSCMQSIKEPPDKYIVLLYDDLSVEKLQLRTRQFYDFGLLHSNDAVDHFVETIDNKLQELHDLASIDELPAGLMMPLLRVRYSHELINAKRRIEKAVDGRGHLFLKQEPAIKPESDKRREIRRASGLKHATTLESKLPEYLETQEKNYLLHDCQRLLQTHGIRDELLTMKKEFVDEPSK